MEDGHKERMRAGRDKQKLEVMKRKEVHDERLETVRDFYGFRSRQEAERFAVVQLYRQLDVQAQ